MIKTRENSMPSVPYFSRHSGLNRILLVLLLILWCSAGAFAEDKAPGRDKDAIAGDYLLQGVMETASGFRLSSDGTYRFFLVYGSVDETDSGTWLVKDNAVVLHSAAPAEDPKIEYVRSFSDDFDGVRIHFEDEGAALATVATTIVLHAEKKEFHANEGSNHVRQSRSTHPPIHKISVSFIGAMREYRPSVFEPRNPAHNNYVFRATTGNYGSVRFNDTPLQIAENELFLMLPNMSEKFRYVRQ